jgi:hypothetical protein
LAKAFLDTDGILKKRCPRCTKIKVVWAFNRQASQSDGFQVYCRDCGQRANNASYANHIDSRRQSIRAYAASHVESERRRVQAYENSHRVEKRLREFHRGRSYTLSRRMKVLAHYGPQCGCCGEADVHFLSIDHIHGGGTAHRKQLRSGGSAIYRWLIAEGFPEGYRVLCMNCNYVMGHYGFCPHQSSDPRVMSYRMARVWQLKLEIIAHYGGMCACCREPSPYFLQLDHPNGDGAEERRRLKKDGNGLYSYLRVQGFPKGYRILCTNCNFALGKYHFCPHTGIGLQLALL